jgi:hypothetical protein
MPEPFQTPVTFIVFNRPETTKKVFDCIREMRPSSLFIIADAPRDDHPEDKAKCAEVMDIINRGIDWECDVKTNISETNQGLKQRISSGLSWVFENVDRTIILEDDCIPDLSFFPYCEELLKKYENDTRIMSISGDNFQYGNIPCPHSYYFSRYMHCWGWATWKRAWDLYDIEMKSWPELKEDRWLDYIITDTTERIYWEFIFDKVYSGEINTWDYPFVFSMWKQRGLSIIPCTNLVSNIGFGENATNTSDASGNNILANMDTGKIELPLSHPENMVRNFIADDFYARLVTKPRRRFSW